MMKSCIVNWHNAGLFSNINKVITCLDMFDRVCVRWHNSLYATPEINLWNQLFEPLDPIPSVGMDVSIIDEYPHQRYTYKDAALIYGNDEERKSLFLRWLSIHPRIEIAREVARIRAGHQAGDVISVIVRAHGHRGEQISDRSQTLDEYAAAIEANKKPNTKVFVMCGDDETLTWFAERFPIFYNERKRAATRDEDLHLSTPQNIHDAVDVLKEVMIVSYSRALIHPVSNMATAALSMSLSMKSIFLP